MPTKRMRVVIVTSIHPEFDKRVWRHARGLARLEIDITLYCPWSVEDGAVIEGVTMRTFEPARTRLSRLLLPFRMTGGLLRLIRQHDIVHFHDIDLLPFMAFCALFKNKFVYDMHENYPDEMLVRPWIPSPLRRAISLLVRVSQWVLCKLVHNIVLVTPSQYRDIPSSCNVLEVRNYASTDQFPKPIKTPSQAERVLLFTGSHYEANGSLTFLDIAHEISLRQMNVSFLTVDLFSSKTFQEHWMTRRKELQLEDMVRVVNPVRSDRIFDLLARGMIGLLPSPNIAKQQKAIPTRIFEYMAAGIPFVASDLPYTKEIVSEAGCGLIVPSDDIRAYADAVESLLNDPKRLDEMSASGRSAFEARYNWESQMLALREFYSSISSGS